MPSPLPGRNRPHPIPAPRAPQGLQAWSKRLRSAKFDIGVRSSKGVWWWTLPASGGLVPAVKKQDGQMNYLAILAIFVKQRTYLATLPS